MKKCSLVAVVVVTVFLLLGAILWPFLTPVEEGVGRLLTEPTPGGGWETRSFPRWKHRGGIIPSTSRAEGPIRVTYTEAVGLTSASRSNILRLSWLTGAFFLPNLDKITKMIYI